MAVDIAPPPATVETIMNYSKHHAEGGNPPVYTVYTAGARRQKHEPHPVKINNIRGHEQEFDLDTHGFQFVKHRSEEKDWYDEDRIKEKAYGEIKKMLKEKTGATHVHIFSHIIRHDPWQSSVDIAKDTSIPDDAVLRTEHPATFAHVDQSYKGARILVDSIPDTADLKPKCKTRWGIINAWRPLKPVSREPLVVCDARSVRDTDLVPITIKVPRGKPKTTGEAPRKTDEIPDQELWQVKGNPEHRWYWPSNMTPDEVLLIKCFDSKKDGRARRAPHSAVQLSNDEGPPRESIEIRCLVFWENQELE